MYPTATTIAQHKPNLDPPTNLKFKVLRAICDDCFQGYMYYVNDGVYGSFNCLVFDHATVVPETVKESSNDALYPSSLWGPTCDSLDCISKTAALPKVMPLYSWLTCHPRGLSFISIWGGRQY